MLIEVLDLPGHRSGRGRLRRPRRRGSATGFVLGRRDGDWVAAEQR